MALLNPFKRSPVPETTNNNEYFDALNMMLGGSDIVEKGLNNRDLAFDILPDDDPRYSAGSTEGYVPKPTVLGAPNTQDALKHFSDNSILNAIINTRANQVTAFSKQARGNEDGVGYRVRLKSGRKPTDNELESIKYAESYLDKMGVDRSPNRDNFQDFLRKLVRDTLTYDQVNYENTYDSKGRLSHTRIVDPTTIYFATDKDGHRRMRGKVFIQRIDNKNYKEFTSDELAMMVRNPTTDVHSMGYGVPELMVLMQEFMSYDATVMFNSRFFSHGGTTRGVLLVKPPDSQTQSSRRALDDFRRSWTASSSGINGSWRIPVMVAEDVKFVDMTPNAQDMQFRTWLEFLVNAICAVYTMDPSEIGMTNRGGATGSRANSLNESNSSQKIATSKSKGLSPLLDMIAKSLTENVIRKLIGDNYMLEFTGGDTETQKERLEIVEQELKNYRTVNEVRENYGLPVIAGGDIPLNAIVVQRLGQIEQIKQNDIQNAAAKLQQLDQQSAPQSNQIPKGISYQDSQAGFNGTKSKPSGKGNQSGVGKDGQSRNKKNTASFGEGAK